MGISASVGAAGRNLRHDVVTVQQLLKQRGKDPGPVDGLCGARTVHAIVAFQQGFLARPDGRVDPNGTTWRHLTQASSPPAPHAPPVTSPPTPADLLKRLPRPDRNSINQGLTAVSPDFMVQQLGKPRDHFSQDCQPMTNTALKRHVVTEGVGRFNVTGLRPAVASLRRALIDVQREQPAVYASLGSAGMLCCRWVRGSSSAISNHSWGTAIDFTLGGVLDRRGDNQVQLGLSLMASIMNRHGWFWGAAFKTEDAMHFEASRASIAQWAPALRA